MEKFLGVMKLSKAGIYIGWTKMVLNSLVAVVLLLSLFLSSAFFQTISDSFKSKSKDSNLAYYGILALLILFFALNAGYSLVLIIGSINHQHLKVLSFVIVDGFFTLLLIFLVFRNFPSWLLVLVTLVQLYLFFSMFSFWKQMNKEHRQRMEHEANRKRSGDVLRSFV